MSAPEIGKCMLLLGAPAKETQQPGGDNFENDGLSDDKPDGDQPINRDVMLLEIVKTVGEEAQDDKKITGHQHRVDDELNRKTAQGLGCFRFHEPDKMEIRYTFTAFKRACKRDPFIERFNELTLPLRQPVARHSVNE